MGSDDAPPRSDPLVGTLVNAKYRVKSAIARGGMGRIYYATQEPLDRPVALKVVQADGDNEDESQFLKRFLQEASILAKLQHPNVVTLFDYGQIEGSKVEKFFIAMEFLAGETLLHRFKTRGRLEIGATLVMGRQIMRGLREAHKRGIVHRDLKPSNIIIVPEGDGPEIVKLVDFGIGKVLGRPGDAQDLTQDGVFVGTPRYMAPEQFEGTASPASDLYALGTIMFQAITGQLPFSGSTMSEFMVAKLARAVPTMREVAPDVQVPSSVESLVMHLLARRPEDRPSMEVLHAHFMACDEEVFGTPHGRRGNSSGPHSLASTGSGPYSMRQTGSGQLVSTGPLGPVSVPMAPDQLRVPLTVVQQIPTFSQADASRGQLTPRPMSSSMRPAPAASGSRAGGFIALGALVVLLLGAGIYWKARARTHAVTSPSAETSLGAAPSIAAAPTPSISATVSASAPEAPAPVPVKESTIALTPDASPAVKSRPPIKPVGTAATGAASGTSGAGVDIRLKR